MMYLKLNRFVFRIEIRCLIMFNKIMMLLTNAFGYRLIKIYFAHISFFLKRLQLSLHIQLKMVFVYGTCERSTCANRNFASIGAHEIYDE